MPSGTSPFLKSSIPLKINFILYRYCLISLNLRSEKKTMKNVITLTLLIISTSILAQNTLLFEDFNSGFPAGWQAIDEDGLAPYNDPAVNFIMDSWVIHEDYDTLGINDSVLISTSWFETAGSADNYIVLPALTLGAFGNYISFDCKSKDQSYHDDFEILFSYSNLNDFTSNPVIFDSVGPSYWTNYTVSLDSAGITGETVYLAFRHNAYDQFILEIDNIKVFTESPMGIATKELNEISFYPNPAKESLTVKGLSEITSYSISDINGKLIQYGTTFDRINLENLTKGFYFLTIGNTISKKLIVE